MKRFTPYRLHLLSIVLLLITSSTAYAIDFDRIVVLGTSLSDPGNAFALTGQAISPPYSELDDFLVPSAPYNIGGHHFSNGATWIEQLARRIHMSESVDPAFANSAEDAFNYAVGGARARDDGANVNLPEQVSAFLNDVGYVAPPDSLYVIDMGSNDVRDALIAGSPDDSQLILSQALTSIAVQMGQLYAAGARKFLILNVADLGVLPSIQILDNLIPGAVGFAGLLAQLFNGSLDAVVASIGALPGVEIARLNVYEKVNEIIANPVAFGLTEVAAPCVTPDVRPFACRKPDRYLFWDGVHPTKAVHGIFAREAAAVLEIKGGHSGQKVASAKHR